MQVECPYCDSPLEVDTGAMRLKCGECRQEFRVSRSLQVTCPECGAELEAPTGAHVLLCGACRHRIELRPAPREPAGASSSVMIPPDEPSDQAEADEETSVIVSAGGGEEQIEAIRAEFAENYEVLESLGHGGMGAIYKARQKQPPRLVVLKVMLNGRFASRKYRIRFEREAQAVARLKHPGIVSVYEYGEAGGQPYFTMEYVEGCSIRQYVLRHELDKRQTCQLVMRVCKAVAYAHQRGVIHRDIKPSNILVDGEGNPRLLDFGLARLVGYHAEEHPQMSEQGEVMGTPSYMSPEQTLGRPDEIDIRSDVYSIGVLFYELLTDTLPYRIDRTRPLESLRIIREFRPRRPSLINPRIDSDLDAIVLKCLEKERDLRYQSAVELGEDIGRYLRGQPVEARPSTTFYHLRKLLWRHRSALLPFLALALVLAALTGFLVLRLARAEREARAAAEGALQAREHAMEKEDALVEFVMALQGVRAKVDSLLKEGRWEEAYRIASFAEQNLPREAGLKGIASAVREAIAAATAEETQKIRAMIESMRFRNARERIQRLLGLARQLDLSALTGQMERLDEEFDELCWRSLVSYNQQNKRSVRALERFLIECPGNPRAPQARELLSALIASIRFTNWPLEEGEARRNQQVTAEVLELPARYEMPLPGGEAMRFALIPAGLFYMGSSGEDAGAADQEPEHRVRITSPFYMSVTELTRGQYEAVTGRAVDLGGGEGPEALEMPVAVSWHQAEAFCAKLAALKNERLDVRLPTEAQWEYACRAGSPGPYAGGLDAESLDRAAWYRASGEGGPRPVARKQPNAWGLYDMHGNMLEWCRDWYDARYYLSSPERDPAGPASGTYRVLRGGSWGDEPEELRAACRKAARPDSARPAYGLRVCFEVLTEDPDQPIADVNVTLLRP